MNKGEQTRRRIIETAMAVLNRNGGEMSISELMRDVNLEKGGIYRHFNGKDEIIAEAVTHYVGLVEDKLKQALAGRTSARERLGAAITCLLSIAHAPITPGGCLVMNMAISTQNTGSPAAAIVRRTFRRWERLFAGELNKGMQAGEFRRDVADSDFAALAISSIEGAIMLTGARPALRAHDAVGRHLESVLDGYMT